MCDEISTKQVLDDPLNHLCASVQENVYYKINTLFFRGLRTSHHVHFTGDLHMSRYYRYIFTDSV